MTLSGCSAVGVSATNNAGTIVGWGTKSAGYAFPGRWDRVSRRLGTAPPRPPLLPRLQLQRLGPGHHGLASLGRRAALPQVASPRLSTHRVHFHAGQATPEAIRRQAVRARVRVARGRATSGS
jgi:hypothetical protein